MHTPERVQAWNVEQFYNISGPEHNSNNNNNNNNSNCNNKINKLIIIYVWNLLLLLLLVLPPVHIFMHVPCTYTWLLGVSFRFFFYFFRAGVHVENCIRNFFGFFSLIFSLKENKIYIFIYMFNYNNNNNNNCMEDVKRKI